MAFSPSAMEALPEGKKKASKDNDDILFPSLDG
jgi:hypothetical protein